MATIYLDESGDLGFSKTKRVSKYFIVTILFTEEEKRIEKLVKLTHANLRKKVKRLSGGVLHAVKESPKTRKKLLSKLVTLKLRVMVICLNKSKVYTKLQNEKHVLYNFVTNILLDRIFSKKIVDSNTITIIASKRETNRFLNQNFESYLKTQVTSKHKVKINIEVKTPGQVKQLQAVDFISWSIFRKYERGDSKYYDIIKKVIVEESFLFP